LKIKRFFARDMRTAMEQVRTALGTEAVIMSSKKVTGGVEVVAAQDYESAPLQETSQASELSKSHYTSFESDVQKEILPEPQTDALEVAHLKKNQSYQETKKKAKYVKQPVMEPTLNEPPMEKPKITDEDVNSLKALLERQSRRLAEQERQQEQDALFTTQKESVVENEIQPIKPNPSKSAKLPEWAKAMAQPYQPSKKAESKNTTLHTVSEDSEKVSRELVEIKADMKSLRDLLTHQVSSLMGEHREREDPLSCMLEKHLIQAQFSEEVAKRLAEMVSDYPPENMLHHLPRVLGNMLSVQRDDIVRQGGVVALVGPTGVGKTTTLAKLAARYAGEQGADRLGMITTDHYRIGAYEQLATYGRIMGCAVKKASNLKELEQALYQLRTRHLVLIDTAGMSQRNMKLSQQLDNLIANPQLPIRNYLVMSAIGQRQVLSDIVEQFKRIPLSGCILTKTDESLDIGGALSVMIEHDLPLSYVTHGQRVPEDMTTADPKTLAEQALQQILERKPESKRAHWAENLVEVVD